MSKKIMLMISIYVLTISLAENFKDRIQQWQTKEGAKVLFIEERSIPILDIIISIDAGKKHEKENYGLAEMTAQMMLLGTNKQDEYQIANALENLGSAISIYPTLESTVIEYRSLSEDVYLNNTLYLLMDILENPRFDVRTFKKTIDIFIDKQKGLLDDLSYIVNEKFYTLLYPGRPQGTTSEMIQASLEKMDIEELRQFYKDYYYATGSYIILVGAIDRRKAEQISATISESLGMAPESNSINSDENALASLKSQVLHQHINSQQTHIIMGHISIDRYDEDYWPLILGNHLLGGQYSTSKLMIELREKQGLVYSVHSSLSPTLSRGPFVIKLVTSNENATLAIDLILKAISNLMSIGPNDKELTFAKNHLIGNTLLNLSSNKGIANALLTMAENGLPLDYYDTYATKINSVTKELVRAAFSRHIHPDKFTTVIIGGD